MKRIAVLSIVLALLLVPGVAVAQEYETGATPPWADSLSQFLQLLLSSVAVPAAVALTLALFRWLKAKALEARSRLPGELVYTIEAVAKMAVAAAEQSGLAGHIAAEGKAKKQWAMAYAENVLRQQFGLVLDLDALGNEWWNGVIIALNGAIEAGVREQNLSLGGAPESRAMPGGGLQ
jgi:hypothetical protein